MFLGLRRLLRYRRRLNGSRLTFNLSRLYRSRCLSGRLGSAIRANKVWNLIPRG